MPHASCHTRCVRPDSRLDRRIVDYGLRNPRGWYVAERASQLSGIPARTLYEWRRSRVFVGDYPQSSPMAWSYRDLVLLRLLAWLRQGRMERFKAAEKIENVRGRLAAAVSIRWVHATRQEMILVTDDDEPVFDGGDSILPFADFSQLMRTLDLHEPIKELRQKNADSVWAPDLVRPSSCTSIVPWVLSGEPCIRHSRIPTSSVFALFDDRGLDAESILNLYPDVTAEAVKDSIRLEARLRRRTELLHLADV